MADDREQAIALGHNGWDTGEQSSEQNSGINNSANMVESPLKAVRKTGGQLTSWKPGQSGNPNGRPKKVDEEEAMAALRRGASPERLEAAFNGMYEHAVQYGGFKAWEAYLKLALPYWLGQPPQFITTKTDALTTILMQLEAKHNPE